MNSNTEKYASPKEVKKTIHQFKKLLWALPKTDRENIVSFIKEETKCCSWWPLPYVSQKLYDTLTGSLSTLNLKNKVNQKETLNTPFSKRLNNKKKSHQLMSLIQKSISFISVYSPEKKEKIFNSILNEPTFYSILNKFKYSALKNIVKLKIEKFSTTAFEMGLSLISPNYRNYRKTKKILKKIKIPTTKTISLKEINTLLGPISQNQTKPKPNILITSKKKSFYQIAKDIRIYTHD